MTARRHHFVPQCYLMGFVKDPKTEQLFAVDIEAKRAFYPTTKNVAVELDFHRVDSPGVPIDEVERRLSDLDGDFATALARVIGARSIRGADDRAVIFTCMSLMFVKNPAMRATVDSFVNKVENYRLAAMAADPVQWRRRMKKAMADGDISADTDTEDLRKRILRGEFNISMAREVHLLGEFKNALALLPHIIARKWTLCKTRPDAPGFVTTDRPVTLMWNDPKDPRPVGIGRTGTQLIFPISSDLLMVGSFEWNEGEHDIDDEFVAELNGNVIIGCDRQIYARDENFGYKMQHFTGIRKGSNLLQEELITSGPDGASTAKEH